MDTLIDPEQFVGLDVTVTPRKDDPFLHEFSGPVIGVRNGFLQVRDADDDVWEVEVSQVAVYGAPGRCRPSSCAGRKI